MNCLSCELNLDSSSKDNYHEPCAESLFGTSKTPRITFSSTEIMSQAQKLVGKMSISGVQAKLSVKLNKTENILEVTAFGGSHILKPSPDHFPFLAENENLFMNMAKELSIETPPHGLLPLADRKLTYIVRRFDRDYHGEKVSKIHVEDFAQLLGKADKYDGSIEQIGKFLMRHSEIPFIDTQKLFTRVLFFFLIGNGDAHFKNFAMIRLPDRGYRLSEAYDIVSSRLVMTGETEELALSLNGKKNNITTKDFKSLAGYLEIGNKRFDDLISPARTLGALTKNYLSNSFLPQEMKDRWLTIFEERYQRIFG